MFTKCIFCHLCWFYNLTFERAPELLGSQRRNEKRHSIGCCCWYWIHYSDIYDLSIIKSLWWQIISNGIHSNATCCDVAAPVVGGHAVYVDDGDPARAWWIIKPNMDLSTSTRPTRASVRREMCTMQTMSMMRRMHSPNIHFVYVHVSRCMNDARTHILCSSIPNCLFISCRLTSIGNKIGMCFLL